MDFCNFVFHFFKEQSHQAKIKIRRRKKTKASLASLEKARKNQPRYVGVPWWFIVVEAVLTIIRKKAT